MKEILLMLLLLAILWTGIAMFPKESTYVLGLAGLILFLTGYKEEDET